MSHSPSQSDENQVCVIIGASHAAAQLATSLRQQGWSGPIRMIGDEGGLPYQRPPLSKAFLCGEKDADSLIIRPSAFYEKHEIEFIPGRVTAIDRVAKTLTLADGSEQHYDKLALCTGTRVIRLPIQGANLGGVHYLRTLADVEGIRRELPDSGRVVIIGGGYIGLETAASLRKQGIDVVVLEMAERVLQRVTAPEVSAFYQRMHSEAGVTIETGTMVAAFEGEERVERVVCADGRFYPADMVIVGIGVRPNSELADAAGLEIDNGIVVDEYCQTQDPDIVAAGDCANQWDPRSGQRRRLESVPNAVEQAKTAAATLCGEKIPQISLPWFWSDQYDLKLQMAGLNQGYDQVVIRGTADSGCSFAAFYFQQGQLIAADCINRAPEFMLAKKLLSQKQTADMTRLADEAIPVKQLMAELTTSS
ncbi:NAD(P)/FAD-dependent oxidoreductase [Alcanivorax sp. 1008]|uniref:NAD(P)/FAD-dependent oxidoreductase n=1 Tax=Alcanivorax sp. 1008 TaxID=2816853 RepID=UPI001E0211E1|nr:FAD/NAD(P)-binding oxidoreductase [Alcanivorax sp. 1008]MCC1495336.1 NAD(P)/FAD-dependent oxidoreductase [Alcanivorax sp. 1008]